MSKRATLKVYDGREFVNKTGRVVKVYETGAVTIDDDSNVRWFADAARVVQVHGNGADAGKASLW